MKLTAKTACWLSLVAAALTVSGLVAAEAAPTAIEVYDQSIANWQTGESGKKQLLAMLEAAEDPLDKLEAANQYILLSRFAFSPPKSEYTGQDAPYTKLQAIRRRNLASHAATVRVALPLFQRLDEEQRRTLPALTLGYHLAQSLFEIMLSGAVLRPEDDPDAPAVISFDHGLTTYTVDSLITSPTASLDDLTTLPLALYEAILDSSQEALGLSAEEEREAFQRLRERASKIIVYRTQVKGDAPFYPVHVANIKRLMAKYSADARIQEIGARKLQCLQAIVDKNHQIWLKRQVVTE